VAPTKGRSRAKKPRSLDQQIVRDEVHEVQELFARQQRRGELRLLHHQRPRYGEGMTPEHLTGGLLVFRDDLMNRDFAEPDHLSDLHGCQAFTVRVNNRAVTLGRLVRVEEARHPLI
jgi:hypothetical protein